MSNEQKVAIVTGASQGIGAGVVKAYRDNGFVVVANSRGIKPSADEGVTPVGGNIGDHDVATQVVKTAVERFGRIDTLINNAGIFISKLWVALGFAGIARPLPLCRRSQGGLKHLPPGIQPI